MGYCHIHSCWNPDRVGACIASRPRKASVAKKPHRYALYRNNEVIVCNSRGNSMFALSFESNVASAIVKDDEVLIVELANGTLQHYDVSTGKLISEIKPALPAGETMTSTFAPAA